MLLLDPNNAADYLRATRRIAPGERVTVQALSGGVSNQVLYVARGNGEEDFVLKQARPQLRTPDPWFCTVERVWREVEVLQICQQVLDRYAPANDELTACTPRILFEDRQNYLLAMTAAPRDHRVWRSELLAGRVESGIAEACGRLLARLHAGTWRDSAIADRLGDRTIFEQLRIEPYFEATARANPDAAPMFARLIADVRGHALCLVHADFSPKNLLVFRGAGLRPADSNWQAGGLPHGRRMMMVDFETGHFGDPAFDFGFFLSHLTLKAFYHAPRHEPLVALIERFGEEYQREFQSRAMGESSRHTPCAVTSDGTRSVPATMADLQQLIARGNQNLAGCAWARLDGTSKVDYLTNARTRDQVRQLCRWVFAESPGSLNEVVARLRDLFFHW